MNTTTETYNTNDLLMETPSMTCYISLGSNMGVPEENLAVACEKLEATRFADDVFTKEAPLYIEARSRIYLTEPQNVKDQPFFANQVLKISCASKITPSMLLHRLLAIETEMGRKRTLRFGPRIIDLDILLIEGIQMENSVLTLPHPRMCERAFVLVPLSEVASDLVLCRDKGVTEVLHMLSYRIEGNVIYQE